MDNIIKPRGKRTSVKNAKFTPESAVKVDVTKGKIAEERKQRLEEAKNKPDQEYVELFETVTALIVQKDFWELVPDSSIQIVYSFVINEMNKRGIKAPIVQGK